MGQFSMTVLAVAGSNLSGNQHSQRYERGADAHEVNKSLA